MRIIISGQGYSVTDALANASVNDLYYLQTKTIDEQHPKGVNLERLQQYLVSFHNAKRVSDLDAEALLGLRCMVFLARRHAGEKLTVDEANDFPLRELTFERDEADDELIEKARARNPFRRRRRAFALAGAPRPEAASPTT